MPDDMLRETREVLVERGRPPDDGRRPRRRLPLRRAGLVARRRDRRALSAPRGKRLQTFAVGTERLARPARRPQPSPSTSAASTTRRPTPRRRRSSALPDVVRAIESFDPGARAQRGAELHARRASPASTSRSCSPARAPTSCSPATYYHARVHRARRRCTPSSCAPSSALHNLNLQRCDRVTMAHGLEARVPFLDREVIAVGLRLPPAGSSPGRPAGEAAAARGVRRLAAGRAPVARRRRSSATAAARATCSPRRSRRRSPTRSSRPSATRSTRRCARKEELAYYRILKLALPGLAAGEAIGRFANP